MHYEYKKDIEALVDGELDEEKARRVRETIEMFPPLKEYYEKMLLQKTLLKAWWQENEKNRH